MRDIKFRAWVKDTHGEPYMVTQGESDVETLGSFAHHYMWQDEAIRDGDITFMQYTGLKDKDGAEIYEGDIVSVAHQKYLSTGDERFYKNGYNNRVVKWRVTSHHNGWNIYDAPQTQFEVIGNIYENPELINGK